MVLTLFRGLLNATLKCERRKLTMTRPHLLTVTPWSPNSDPVVSKKMMGHDVYPTWIVVTLTTGHNCQDPAQTEDKPWRADCSTSPRPSWVSAPTSSSTGKVSQVACGWWPDTNDTMVPPSPREATETTGAWAIWIDTKAVWICLLLRLLLRPLTNCSSVSGSRQPAPSPTIAIYSSFHMEKSGLAFSRAPK